MSYALMSLKSSSSILLRHAHIFPWDFSLTWFFRVFKTKIIRKYPLYILFWEDEGAHVKFIIPLIFIRIGFWKNERNMEDLGKSGKECSQVNPVVSFVSPSVQPTCWGCLVFWSPLRGIDRRDQLEKRRINRRAENWLWQSLWRNQPTMAIRERRINRCSYAEAKFGFCAFGWNHPMINQYGSSD